jgi:hypothetical protein
VPNVVHWKFKDDKSGFAYGISGAEFFQFTFEAGQYPNGVAEAREAIEAGVDPAELAHAELKRFPLSDLTEIRAYQGWTHIDVRHRDAMGKSGEVTLYFDTMELAELARELAQATGRSFREAEVRASIISLLTFPGIVLLAVGFVLGLVYLAANDMEHGKAVPIAGRKAILRAIIVGAATVLGTKGCLMVGGILGLLIFAWIVRNIVAWPRDLLLEFR